MASLIGNASNDTFNVTSWTTSVDGKGGTDTAIFSEDISRYTIARSGGFIVTNVATGQVTTVTNTEVLKFAGGSEVYTMSGGFVPSATGAVVGTAGNDVFTVTSGWKSVDGAGGSNTAKFADDISHYTILTAPVGLNVTNVATGQAVTLQNVQTFNFNGGTEAYTAATGSFVPNATGLVIGTSAHDTIPVTATMTAIDGAGGSNTAIFADHMSQYAIAPAAAGLDVTNLATHQAVHLDNVQAVKFNGGSEVYSPPTSGTNPPAS